MKTKGVNVVCMSRAKKSVNLNNSTGSKFLQVLRQSAMRSPNPGAKQSGSIAAKHCPIFIGTFVLDRSQRRFLCDGLEPEKETKTEYLQSI